MLAEVAEYDLDLNPPPATILDIGANIGAFSWYYLQKWPMADIHAWEPIRDTFLDLCDVCTPLGIKCHNSAVRSFTGEAEIFIGDRAVTCGFHQLGRQTNQTKLVHCFHAGDIPSAELVKIDTEGCEAEIINYYDFSKTRAVVVEYHSQADLVGIVNILHKALGFELLEHIPHEPGFGVLKFAMPGAGVSLPGTNGRKPMADSQKAEGARPAASRCWADIQKPMADSRAEGVKTTVKVYIAVASHYAANDLIFGWNAGATNAL